MQGFNIGIVTQEHLATLIEHPEIHRRLLGNYDGAYSLGVTLDPQRPGDAAIRIRVEGDASAIPSTISIGSERVRVIAQPNFAAPRPLAARV